MKKFTFLMGLLPFLALNAQSFEEKETLMKDFYYSSGDIGDFDGDGFQDVVMNGAIDSDLNGNVDLTHNEIYRNNNGVLELYGELGEYSTHLGDIRFFDFDNDGLLDIVSTGLSYNDIVNYQHYRFQNTGSGFEAVQNTPGRIYSSIDVFDLNHDGFLDYAINGIQYVEGVGFTYDVELHKNIGNDFEMPTAWLPGTQGGGFKVLDVNNDGELDVVVLGMNGSYDAVFQIYINNNGVLELNQEFPGMNTGDLAFADFNADGFLDLVAVGQDGEYDLKLNYYLNNGEGSFEVHTIEGEGLSGSSVDVGDLNNDGYYDFIIIGDDDNYDAYVKVFIYNPEEGNFSKFEDTGLYNLGSNGMIRLFDYNNDNHLDVLMSGFDWADPDIPALNKLFENISTEENQKPTPPTLLNLEQNGNRIHFSWEGANDDKTPTEALQYEIRVGTASGLGDIAKYKVTTPFWYLDLEEVPETIFWSVRSMDASKVYSEYSDENELSNQELNIAGEFKLYPNPAKDIVYLKSDQKVDSVELFTLNGQRMKIEMRNDQINVSQLPKGIYVLKIQSGQCIVSKKLIIQ